MHSSSVHPRVNRLSARSMSSTNSCGRMRTVPSRLAVAKYLPSGLYPKPYIRSLWSSRASSLSPVLASHILMLSPPMVAICEPSGLNALGLRDGVTQSENDVRVTNIQRLDFASSDGRGNALGLRDSEFSLASNVMAAICP